MRLSILIPLALAVSAAAAAPLAKLSVRQARVVNEHGTPVTLRGCNLGNWLLIEAWMLGWDIEDQETIIQVLADRFGQAEADRLMTIYRDGYITPRDFESIRSFGFNVVRLPFDSRMLIDDAGAMRPDGFKYIDRCLDMAEAAGCYVILDMHGAPGGQSMMDHTGRRDQNRLWADPALQQRMVELWRTIAERYKDRTVVAAYDMLNEPYGDFRTDLRPALRELMPRVYRAIRSVDPNHIVIFPNALGAGITFYGPLADRGYHNIAFTDHYYAGLFGSPTTVRSHANMFFRVMPEAQSYLDANNAAMLIGEFNVVFEAAGGDPMMRRYYDEFAQRGWMATMWSYKLLKPDAGVQPNNWYLVTNAGPLPRIDVRTSSLEEIEGYFSTIATMPLAVDETLRTALTQTEPAPVYLPDPPALPLAAPARRTLGEWSLLDVDCAMPSGLSVSGEIVSIVAAGAEVFGSKDSFAFLSRPAPRVCSVTATVHALADSDQWAKAGIMLRFGDANASDYDRAPFVMINTFVDGGIAFLVRDRHGADAVETKRVLAPLPHRISLVRDGSTVEAFVETAPDQWLRVGSAGVQAAGPARIGMVTLSHNATRFTQADFGRIEFTTTPPRRVVVDAAQPAFDSATTNLLVDSTFDRLADGSWSSWGNGLSRTADGISLGGNSGLWQDVAVEPGKTYAFAVRLRRSAGESQDIDLVLEAGIDGQQLNLDSRGFNSNTLEAGESWSIVRVQAKAMSKTLRALIRSNASADSARVEIAEMRLWKVND